MKHTKISPSIAERVMECPMSVELNAYLGDESEDSGNNEHAKEGIRLHKEYEEYIKNNFEGEAPEYFEHLENQLDLRNKILFVESHLYITKEIEGTCDLYFYDNNTLNIVDYKFGRVDVKIEDNLQLILYASPLLMINKNIENVVLHIYQPLVTTRVKRWSISREDVLKKTAQFTEVAEKKTNYKISPECKYCNVKNRCKLFNEMFSNLYTIPEIEVLKLAEVLKKHADDVKKYVDSIISKHTENPPIGFEIKVTKRRKIEDVDKIVLKEGYTTEDLYTQTLKNLGQLEKVADITNAIGYTYIKKLIYRPEDFDNLGE